MRRSDSLEDAVLTAAQIAGVGAAVATAAARLHAAGQVHGAIAPSTVTIDPASGIPSLSEPRGQGRPADDVAAIGSLLTSLLARQVPGDPWSALTRRVHGTDDGEARWAVARIAAAAGDPRDDRRPSAESLAAQLAAVEGAALPAARPEQGRPDHARRRPWARAVAVLVVATGAVGAGVVARGRFRAPPREPPVLAEAKVRADPASTTLPPSPGPAARLWPPTDATMRACPPAGPDRRGADRPVVEDVDGDGCPDAVTIDATSVSVGAAQFTAGQPGDLLVLGDWRCEGASTVALVRPSTGEVFVFDGWAPSTSDLAGRLVRRVPGATGLRAADRCGHALVDVGTGAPVDIATGSSS